MGLLCVILPAIGGKYITIMSPSAFVRRPYRWIKELAAASDGACTFAAAPNFAFEHAAVRGLPKTGRRAGPVQCDRPDQRQRAGDRWPR